MESNLSKLYKNFLIKIKKNNNQASKNQIGENLQF